MKIFSMHGDIFIKSDKAFKSLDRMNKGLNKVGKGFKTLGKVTAAGAGIATAAIIGLAKKTADLTDNVDKMSQKIGISRKAYQEWDFILSQNGASIDGLQTGMKTLSSAIFEAGQGTKSYVDDLTELGLTYEDLNGMSQEEQFEAVFFALQDVEDATTRTAIASKLLGKSATELAPALNLGTEAIEKQRQEAHDLGLVLSDEAVDAGVNFTDAMDKVKRSLTGAVTEGFAPMLPKITEMSQLFISKLPLIIEKVQGLINKIVDIKNRVTEWIADNSEKIDGIKQKFIDLFNTIKTIIQPAIDKIKEMSGENDFLTVALDGVIKVVEIFVDILTTAATWLDENQALVKALAVVIGIITAAFVIYNIAMVVATAAATAFGIVMAIVTSPITLVVLAIAAVIAIVILLVKNWDKIKAKTKEIWNSIADFFKGIGEKIKKAFTDMVDKAKTWGKDLIQGFIDGIKEKFTALKDGIKRTAEMVKSFLGFSVPDKGPLSDADQYGGDFIDLYVKKINANKGKLTNAIRGLATDMNINARPNGNAPRGPSGSGINPSVSTGGITQNITINSPKALSPLEIQRQTKLAARELAFAWS